MLELKRITPINQHCFFGYYDKSPWNDVEDRMLYTKTTVNGRLPETGEKLTIGIIDLDSGQPGDLLTTSAWNFQQGCMLQWLSKDTFIYNDLDSGRAISVVANLSGEQLHRHELAIYAVSHDKQLAMGVDFGRLHRLRPGYGYEGAKSNDSSVLVSRIDLNTGKSSVVLTTDDFHDFIDPKQASSSWVDHILFSSDDRNIVFLLRSLTPDGGVFSRLFCCNAHGEQLKCLLDTGMASHADWYDNQHIAIWGRKKQLVANLQKASFSKLLKPLINLVRKVGVPNIVRNKVYGDEFLMININSGEISTFAEKIPANEGGGHFTFAHNARWMLNDTICLDQSSQRELMLYDMTKSIRYPIAKLFTPEEIYQTPYRCDLHPRWSPSGKQVCIDSVHEGYRGMYIIDVENFLTEHAG
ncbi:MAG: hypothetical protein CMF39_05740 [Legionellaceae bacterium]|nr:hypothetical protein [Legionellaceae bacterium]|tara:strand:- start:611 stop:1846 length:1236 start_codon:yes stop_codon:yes gene_type:complete